MGKTGAIPEVSDQNSDRGITELSRRSESLARNPLVNGVLVDLTAPDDGEASVAHGLGRIASGAIIVGSDRGVFTACVSSSGSSNAVLSIARQWEVIERVDVSILSTSFDFKTALNGDTDYEYMVDGYWICPALASDLIYRVNGAASTALTGDGYAQTGSLAAGTGVGLTIAVAFASEVSTYTGIHSVLRSAVGQVRFGYSNTTISGSAVSSATFDRSIACKWHDTATHVKSLGIQSTTASSIAVGSHFTLHRRPRLKGRKLKIWIF